MKKTDAEAFAEKLIKRGYRKWYDGYRTANIALDKAGIREDNKVLEKWWME